VQVGEYAHMGIGSMAIPGAKIGDGAIVGAGGVVLGSVPANTTVVGNLRGPAGPCSELGGTQSSLVC